MRTYKTIQTFNGIGAASEAMSQMGLSVEEKTVCEIDKFCNETYYKNFKRDIHFDDINNLVYFYKKYNKINNNKKKVDFLIQTPPCQSFSLQGKRKGFESENGNLFLKSIQLQKLVDSNVVIYENVKGLISHGKDLYVYEDTNNEEVLSTCKLDNQDLKFISKENKFYKYQSLINPDYEVGYTLHKIELELLDDERYNWYWKVLNILDCGYPQNRERIFIVGIKKELDNGFNWFQHQDLQFTIKDILDDDKDVDESFYYKKKNIDFEINPKETSKLKHFGILHNETYESDKRVYEPFVSPTVLTHDTSKFFIKGKIRCLTNNEIRKIFGFSDQYKFNGSKTQIRKQLGNTVSPVVYRFLFQSILDCIERKISITLIQELV